MTTRELIDYCLTYADAYEDYPFDTEWAVMRHRSNSKSFALIYERDGKLCINLKCDPMRADFLRRAFDAVVPAYHMNKVHWNTVYPEEGLPRQELDDMIDHSYQLTAPRMRKGKKSAEGDRR